MKVVARNRKARHDYHILETIEAGIELAGTEVKSLREGKASISEAYVTVDGGEAFVIGMTIPQYSHRGSAAHEPDRKRRLLLRRREIGRLAGAVARKGTTAVPLSVYFTPRGWAKVEVAIVRGKAAADRREDIRRRSAEREMLRARRRRR